MAKQLKRPGTRASRGMVASRQKRSKKPESRFESLSAITRQITQLQETDRLLAMILEEAGRLLKAEGVGIRVLVGDELRLLARTEAAKDVMILPSIKVGESLTGRVALENRPMTVYDLSSDRQHIPEHNRPAVGAGFRSFLGVPFRLQDKVIGTLSILTKEHRHFSQEEIDLVSAFADQAAVAIQYARLYEQTQSNLEELKSANLKLERSTEEQRALREILTQISLVDMGELLKRITEHSLRLLKVDHVQVRLLDESGHLRMVTVAGERAECFREGMKFGSGRSRWVMENRKPLAVKDISQDKVYGPGHFLREIGVKGYLVVPLITREQKSLGVITLSTLTEREFTEKEIALAEQFAAGAAIAIENARLYEEAQRREEIQKLLKELNQDITSLDLDSLLRKLTEKVREFLRVDMADLTIFEGEKWQVKGLSGADIGDFSGPRKGTARGRVGWILKNRRPLSVPDITQEETIPAGERLKALGIRGYLGVPLISTGEKIIGVLRALTRQPREFTQEEVELLQQMANGAAIALENAQLLEHTKKQAVDLERANKAQADFVAMIAHDLRSPLTNVVSTVTMMQDGLFGPINEEQWKWLAKIETSVQRLVELVNDFLDLSKIEAGQIDLRKEEVDLERLILDTLDNHRLLAESRKISLVNRLQLTRPQVHIDSRRLEQVLINLLANAIKFTGEGGTIEVGAYKDGDAGIHVYVKDNGVGIPLHDMPNLFEKYRQTTSGKTSKDKGTGLGLVICKMIIEAHGGRIWVESEEGKGSTFTVTIPCQS